MRPSSLIKKKQVIAGYPFCCLLTKPFQSLRKDLCKKKKKKFTEGCLAQRKQCHVLSVQQLYYGVSVNIYPSLEAQAFGWLTVFLFPSTHRGSGVWCVWTLIHAVTSPDLLSPSAGFIFLPLRASLVITLQAWGTEELRKHTHTIIDGRIDCRVKIEMRQ